MSLPPPRPHHDDRGFWEGAAAGELRLPRCEACDRPFWPGGPVCPRCLSPRVVWARCSGRGRVSSWVRFHKSYFEGAETPYVVAQVDLEEGPRLFATLLTDEPSIGMEVEAVFTQRDGFVLPEFVPAARSRTDLLETGPRPSLMSDDQRARPHHDALPATE